MILFLSLCGGRNPEKSETVDSWELFERHQHFCQQIAGGLQPLEGLFSFAWLFRRDGNYWFFLSVTGVGTVHPHIITYLPSGTKRLVVNAVSGLTSMYIHTQTLRKVKPIWILLKQETVSGSGISWAVCKSAPCSRHITTPAPPPLSFLQAGCPSCRPTNSIKALKPQHTQTQNVTQPDNCH